MNDAEKVRRRRPPEPSDTDRIRELIMPELLAVAEADRDKAFFAANTIDHVLAYIPDSAGLNDCKEYMDYLASTIGMVKEKIIILASLPRLENAEQPSTRPAPDAEQSANGQD